MSYAGIRFSLVFGMGQARVWQVERTVEFSFPSKGDKGGLTTTVSLPLFCKMRDAVYLLLSSSI